MAKSKDAGKKGADSNENFASEAHYSKIIINKTMRLSFLPIFILLFIIFSGLIFQALVRGESWITLVFPILGMAAMICLFPLTEEWSYTPWQTKAQRYEREFHD